jgi:hypothetical protein
MKFTFTCMKVCRTTCATRTRCFTPSLEVLGKYRLWPFRYSRLFCLSLGHLLRTIFLAAWLERCYYISVLILYLKVSLIVSWQSHLYHDGFEPNRSLTFPLSIWQLRPSWVRWYLAYHPSHDSMGYDGSPYCRCHRRLVDVRSSGTTFIVREAAASSMRHMLTLSFHVLFTSKPVNIVQQPDKANYGCDEPQK